MFIIYIFEVMFLKTGVLHMYTYIHTYTHIYIYIYIYIYIQTVLFRPHECSADAEMKVKL